MKCYINGGLVSVVRFKNAVINAGAVQGYDTEDIYAWLARMDHCEDARDMITQVSSSFEVVVSDNPLEFQY